MANLNFEFGSSIPNKIKNILKPSYNEIANQFEKIPAPDNLLENLRTNAELQVKKISSQSQKEKIWFKIAISYMTIATL